MSPSRPVRWGPFHLKGMLGQGGMAQVFWGDEERGGRRYAVAVKVPRYEVYRSDPDAAAYFKLAIEREANLGATLDDDHLINVRGADYVQGVPYVASLLLEGCTLEHLLGEVRAGRVSLTLNQRLDIAEQMAAGLAYLHDKEVVHRDLKPSNVFITRGGVVKLMDLGIAGRSHASVGKGWSGSALRRHRTLGYASPEQLFDREVSEASDVFTFGVVLYEVMTGEPLFPVDPNDPTMSYTRSLIQLSSVLVAADASHRLEELAAGLGALLDRCVVEAPQARLGSGGEVERDVFLVRGGVARDENLRGLFRAHRELMARPGAPEPAVTGEPPEPPPAHGTRVKPTPAEPEVVAGTRRKPPRHVADHHEDDGLRSIQGPLSGVKGWAAALAVPVLGVMGWLALSGGDEAAPASSPDRGVSPLGEEVLIPGGRFTMGCVSGRDDVAGGCFDNEKPAQEVRVGSFLLMKGEVSQGMWKALMGGTNPSHFSACGDECPVEDVDWFDALRFANAASAAAGLPGCFEVSGESVRVQAAGGDPKKCEGYRLPTEEEWEYAARGGAEFAYSGSGEVESVGWVLGNSDDKTHASCGLAENGYGLCDMTGNVWEWTWSLYGAYGEVPSGSLRVPRGGSWYDAPRLARVARRRGGSPGSRRLNLGFRLSRSVP